MFFCFAFKHENTTKYRKENAKDPNWDKDF